MVSFRDGVLRIQKSESDRFFRLPFEICFYLGMVIYYLVFSKLHYIGVAALMVGPAVITCGKLYNSRINKPILSFWYLAFIALAELSSLWAYAPLMSALKYVKFMMLILVICFGITQYVDTKEDAERILDIYLYGAITIALIQFIGTPYEHWYDGYFGAAIGGNNTNTFGYILLYAAIIAFYKAYIKKERLWYLAEALLLFGCVLSSSRKAIAVVAFGILFIVFFAFRRKGHFFHFLIVIGIIVAAFIFFMENEVLYEIIGKRLENLIDFTSNNSSVYEMGSLQLREYYVDFAKLLFKRKPVLGQGFANFATLLAAETKASHAIYAHNNYWELLADLGIIGFITYYWFYFYLLIKLGIKLFRKEFTYLKLLALSMLLSEFIIEWGVVSMHVIYPQLVIALIYICMNVDDAPGKKQFFYSNSQPGRK